MVSKLDMALGDIVKSSQSNRTKNKKGGGRGRGRNNTRGGGRGRGRGRGSGRRGGYGGSRQGRTSYRQSPYQRQGYQNNRRQGSQNNRGGSHQPESTQISISNLNVQVTEADVREIFSSVGRIRNVAVHYDARGRSRGTAVVTFQTRGQAIKAVNEYHQAEVDGRPMYVRTVSGSGDGPARKRSVRKPQQQRRQRQSNKKGGNNNTRGRGKKGGRGRGGKRNSAPTKTAEQLDKEMEDYHNNVNSGVDAVAAGQPSTAKLFDGQPSADGAEE